MIESLERFNVFRAIIRDRLETVRWDYMHLIFNEYSSADSPIFTLVINNWIMCIFQNIKLLNLYNHILQSNFNKFIH